MQTKSKFSSEVYNRIDRNHDNNLSVKEMENVTDVKEKLDAAVFKLKKIEDKREMFTAMGVLGSVGASCLCGLLAETAKAGWIGAGISIAVGTALCLTNRHVAKSKAATVINQLEQETNNHPYVNAFMDAVKNMVTIYKVTVKNSKTITESRFKALCV